MGPLLPRPLLGRRVALELRPARPLTSIGPAWATICGAIASGGFVFSGETLFRLLIAVILTDPILGGWRAAWVSTDWRAPLRDWRATTTRSLILLPYTRLNSPAARASQWMLSRAKFWNTAVWPEVGQSISVIFISGLIALTVALVLGPLTFLITLGTLLLAPLEMEMDPSGFGRWHRALAEIGAAWLIGHAALAHPDWSAFLADPRSALLHAPWASVCLAILFSVTFRGLLSLRTSREFGFTISNLGQIGVGLVLVWIGGLVHAGFVWIGLLAQALWQALFRRIGSEVDYLPRIQWFIIGAMLVSAIASRR